MSYGGFNYTDKLGSATTINTSGAWGVRSVNSAPANSLIYVGFGSPVANRTIGVREVGSSANALRTLLAGDMCLVTVRTNANAQIEMYASSNVTCFYWGKEE